MKAHDELREKIAEFIEDIRLYNPRNQIGSDEKAADDILRLISEEIKKLKNPYPSNIFITPTKEEFAKLNKAIYDLGFTPDKFNGSWGREVFDFAKQDVLDLLGGG